MDRQHEDVPTEGRQNKYTLRLSPPQNFPGIVHLTTSIIARLEHESSTTKFTQSCVSPTYCVTSIMLSIPDPAHIERTVTSPRARRVLSMLSPVNPNTCDVIGGQCSPAGEKRVSTGKSGEAKRQGYRYCINSRTLCRHPFSNRPPTTRWPISCFSVVLTSTITEGD